jgi:hypothetical protein
LLLTGPEPGSGVSREAKPENQRVRKSLHMTTRQDATSFKSLGEAD